MYVWILTKGCICVHLSLQVCEGVVQNLQFYEIKRDLFQSEKEFFTDELHNMH